MTVEKNQEQVLGQIQEMRKQCTDNVIRLNILTTRILDEFSENETLGTALIEIMEHVVNINLTVQKMWQ